jgi:hypothetical protein
MSWSCLRTVGANSTSNGAAALNASRSRNVFSGLSRIKITNENSHRSENIGNAAQLIAPVVVSFVAILLTTLVLFMIDSYLARRTAGLSSDKTY